MTLKELWAALPEAAAWNFTEQIKLFAWHLHTHVGKEAFSARDIQNCFEALTLQGPSNYGRQLQALEERRPKQMLKKGSSYQLESRVRTSFDERYGLRDQTVVVHQLLTDLIPQMPNERSREYLQEALICFKHKAYRAAVVMTWNVTFDHMCNWILSDAGRLSGYNAQAQLQFQRRTPRVVAQRSDFQEYQESDVISVCRIAGLIDKNVSKVLSEKLDKRNQAAHPSGVVFDQLVTEGVISDLIKNVLLVLR